MDSASIYKQIQKSMGNLNPLLSNLPGAEDYFKKKVGEAYQYNLPVMQNAAQTESKLYTLPGDLMNQYDTEFGGQTGIDSATRINQILKRLGGQSALANTAWGLVDQANMKTGDLAKSLADQYKAKISAEQMRLDPLMKLWDRTYSEEQANKRAGGSSWTNPFAGLELVDTDGDGKPDAAKAKTTVKPNGAVSDAVNAQLNQAYNLNLPTITGVAKKPTVQQTMVNDLMKNKGMNFSPYYLK